MRAGSRARHPRSSPTCWAWPTSACYEIATFYTMFQLPRWVGRPTCRCAARRPACCAAPRRWSRCASSASITIRTISRPTANSPGRRSSAWAAAPTRRWCRSGKDTYEDSTPELFEKVLDGFAAGKPR